MRPSAARRALLSVAVAAGALPLAALALLGALALTDSDALGGSREDELSRAVPAPMTAPMAPRIVISVAQAGAGRAIAPGFVGLSVEFPAIRTYTGPRPGAINPVLEQLVRNLAPDQSPVLRIGGDSTDSTWWPIAATAQPGGVSYTLGRRWLATTRSLARNLHARLIVGVNLKVDRPSMTIAETRALVAGLGRRHVQAVEIGNEPDNYGQFPWYHVAGHPIYARTNTYSFGIYAREFSALRARLRSIPLAGPAVGGYKWLSHTGSLLAADPRLALVTFHRYPLDRCFVRSGSPQYPTIRNLLSRAASSGLVARMARYVRLARAHGVPFRVDEMNSVACGGEQGVSDTFASALWVLDALFEMARLGVDGVNIHTFPGAAYELFSFKHTARGWGAVVRAEYYGLLMFARAAPAGARLLKLRSTPVSGLKAWATLTRAGTVHVVLINDSLRHRRTVGVRLHRGYGPGTVERLTAAGARATRGVTLAGQRIATPSFTGALSGAEHVTVVRPASGSYVVTLRPASAALLSIPGAG